MAVNTVTRASIIRGPAIVSWNGGVFYFKGGLKLATKLTLFHIDVDAYGEEIDSRVVGREISISGMPSGDYQAVAAIACPYGSAAIGSSIMGSDTPLTIQTRAGKHIVFKAAAIRKLPSLTLSTQKTPLGSMEWLCMGSDNTDWTGSNQLYTVTDVGWSDASFVEANIITDQWNGAWGSSSPWNAIATKDGWTIDFDIGMEPVPTDAEGVADYTLTKVVVSAKCIPIGVAETDLLGAMLLQGAGAVPGRSLNASANTLTLTGVNSSKVVTINGANFVSADQNFGAKELRAGEIMLKSTRTFSAGAPVAQFTIA
jgi:hypothetical protein